MTDERTHPAGETSVADQRAEFVATLGHELSGPIGAIRNALAVLRAADLPAPTFQHARAIAERQTEHMANLVERFLDLGRLSHGKMQLDRRCVLMAAVIRQAVETTRPLIDSRRHRLTVVLPPVPLFVDGDLLRLSQVLSNILQNAAKYTERGGRILIRLERAGGEAVLRVSDNGIGIRLDVLPHVFKRFAQAPNGIGHRDGGLGLGLALAGSIVHGLGGSIEASSAGEHMGSEFVVRLPLSAAQPGATSPGSSHRVLIVDQSLGAADSIAILGNLPGNEVNWTLDADTGLALARDVDPHLVVLDLGSLAGDGHGFALRLRNQHHGRPIVVGMLATVPHDLDRQRARQAGLDHCLGRPTDEREWLALLAASRADRAGIRAGPGADVA